MLLALDQGRPDRFDGLQSIDFGAVVLYFIVMLIAGYYFSKKQKSTEEYFMAGRSMPWFVVGLSMFATLLSTVSYLSSPGEIIKNGLGIWGGQMHIPFTLALVTVVLIPFFMRKRFTSAYEYLEAEYGLGARLFASILFMLNRLFWMGMIGLHRLLRHDPDDRSALCLGGRGNRHHRHHLHHHGWDAGGHLDRRGPVRHPLRRPRVYRRLHLLRDGHRSRLPGTTT